MIHHIVVTKQQVNVLQDVSLDTMDGPVTTRVVNCVYHVNVTNRTAPVKMDVSAVTDTDMVFVKDTVMRVSVLQIIQFSCGKSVRNA